MMSVEEPEKKKLISFYANDMNELLKSDYLHKQLLPELKGVFKKMRLKSNRLMLYYTSKQSSEPIAFIELYNLLLKNNAFQSWR